MDNYDITDPGEILVTSEDPRVALTQWADAELKRGSARAEVAKRLRALAAAHHRAPTADQLPAMADEVEQFGAVGHREALERAQAANPLIASHGVRAGDPWSGGLSLFFFYETAEARATALLDHHAFLELAADAEPQAVWKPVRTRLAEVLSAGDVCAEEINSLTQDWYTVDWIGTFEELCEGADAVAAAVRLEFRQYAHDSDDESPLPDDERAAFADFLREHGC
jgi:hypothetical protein